VKTTLMLVLAVGLGVSIAHVDRRPNWDDTGVTAFALFLIAAVRGVGVA
jgi:hypothetical protein